MNVTFRLPTPVLEQRFIAEAVAHNLFNLEGHARVGGVRPSLYNAMPMDGIKALLHFMQFFQEKHVTEQDSY